MLTSVYFLKTANELRNRFRYYSRNKYIVQEFILKRILKKEYCQIDNTLAGLLAHEETRCANNI